MPKEPLTCDDCAGECCSYVAVELEKPKCKDDFEDMIYYLLHEGVKISVVIHEGEPETWYLEFAGRCRHLDDKGWCTIYKHRPKVCRDHKVEECEHHDPDSFHDITTVHDLLEFMRQIGRHKWASRLAQRLPVELR